MLLLNREFDLQDYVNVMETCLLLGDWWEAECFLPGEMVVYTKQIGKRAGFFSSKAADDLPLANFCSLERSLLKTINEPPWEVQYGLCSKLAALGGTPDLDGQSWRGTAVTRWMQDLVSRLNPWSVLTMLFQEGHQKPLEVIKKVMDHSHVDILTPKPKMTGTITNGNFLHVP